MLKLVHDTRLLLTMDIQDTLCNQVFLSVGSVQPVAWLLPFVHLLEELIPVPSFESSYAISFLMPVLLVMLAAKEVVKVSSSSLNTLQWKIVQLLTSGEQDTEVRAIQKLKSQQLVSEPALCKNWQKRIEDGKQTLTLIEEGFQEAIDQGKVRNAIRLRVAALAMIGIQNALFSLWLANRLLRWLEKRVNRVFAMLLRDMVPD